MAIYPSKISVFLLGFIVGVILAFFVVLNKHSTEFVFPKGFIRNLIGNKEEGNYYEEWLSNAGYAKESIDFDHLSYSRNKSLAHLLESQLLKAKNSVLCVMFIKNVNNAYAALNTWMKLCDGYKFYSTKPENYLEVTVMRPKSSWQYLCDVIRHVNVNFNQYMWILFVPDDVYAIPENLRYYVFGKNFNDPYYLGHSAFFWNEHFNLAQAGYVLSKGALKSIVKKFPTSESCKISGKYWKNEDYYLGKYLSELGVGATDTRDHLGRGRFHMFTPAQLMAPGDSHVLSKYSKSSLYPTIQGRKCCSPRSITFQGTDRGHMYWYHYLLYSVHVHTSPGRLGNVKSDTFTSSDQVWQRFVLDELGPDVNLSTISAARYYLLWDDKIDNPSIFNKKLRALFKGRSDD